MPFNFSSVAGLLVVLVATLPLTAEPAQAQCEGPVFGPRAGEVEGRKSGVPLGFASEDWSWGFATGRAMLATLPPTAAGSAALRIAGRESRGVRIGAGVVTAAAVAVGPSLGQWSLGGNCTGRSIFPTVLRVGGIGGVAWALSAARDAEGWAAPVAAALLSIPGLVAVTVGTLWALNGTPRIAVRPEEREGRAPSIGLQPLVHGPTGSGLQLRLQW